jgi:hypothetical protein
MIRRWWCKMFHDSLMHPFRGQYQCRCGLLWPVKWEAKRGDA